MVEKSGLKGLKLGVEKFRVEMSSAPFQGQASFHDAFIPHSSTPNNSEKRRCAWIVRYIPRDTVFVESNRNDFKNHELIPAN